MHLVEKMLCPLCVRSSTSREPPPWVASSPSCRPPILDGGKAGVEIGISIIPGVLIISTFVMMITFDTPAGDYTGAAYEGVPILAVLAEELRHCAFEGVDLTFTSDIRKALTEASYVVSSGGAARKAGMTREDLLKGNARIAASFGDDIRRYCPEVKHVVVVFNPADITGLVTLIHSGLRPSQVTFLAALDSTRLQSELSKYFKIPASATATLTEVTASRWPSTPPRPLSTTRR